MKTFFKIAFASSLFFIFGCSGSSNSPTTGSSASFTVTAPNAPSSYNINGTEGATLTLQRGQTYTFAVNATGHPFYIMTTPGINTANAYSSGVTNNGIQNGTLTFAVPSNAPNTLYYDCSVHSAMVGTINITN